MIGRARGTLADAYGPVEGYTAYRAGADAAARARLPEFVELFVSQGARLTGLADPLSAAAVGAALSAPFRSVTDLVGGTRRTVLAAVAEQGSRAARAALLALAAGTDGVLEALAGSAAGRMDRRIPEPPWAAAARRPVTLLGADVLLDPADPRAQGLLVGFEQAGQQAHVVLRFHPDSMLAARIHYLPGTTGPALLAELAAGSDLVGPYRFATRSALLPADLSRIVDSMLEQNRVNLGLGAGWPPYPPDLVHVGRLAEVSVVPGMLVLLRTLVGAALGVGGWDPEAPVPGWS